jgi:transketolase
MAYRQQHPDLAERILPRSVPTVSVEAGTTFGWERFADICIGIDRFGASAPGSEVLDRLGISVVNIKNSVLGLIASR